MKFIGLLMIANENDILAEVIAHHEHLVDAFYVLDGTIPDDLDESRRICEASAKCGGYITDAELPRPPYPDKPVCGYRQAIYEMAVAEHGFDNWFLILHGDEIWTKHPGEIVDDNVDSYCFQLPFFFPRAGEEWDYSRGPLEQLRWNLGPGFPEWRMFRGDHHVRYDETQTYNTMPAGVRFWAAVDAPILHYLYRSPDAQRARARQHVASGFDPDNYRHILDHDAVYWTDEMIAAYQQKPEGHFRELSHVDD